MDDLISRKAAIERIEKQKYREPSIGVWKQNDRVALVCYDTVIEALKRLPSAEPKHGHWDIEISDDGYQATYHCSECGHQFKWLYDPHFPPVFNYCQKCGAKMEADHDSD